MTKKEMAMMEEMLNTIKALNERIDKLEKVNTVSRTETVESEYAIGKAITEDFGGTKLAKGNAVYDKCHKADKYVQVYEFKTVADCKKFMAEQQKRVG